MPKLRITLKMTRKNRVLARQLAQAKGPGLNRAADFLVAELRKVVSRQYPLVKYRNRHNLDAGQPPFQRSGAGRESIRRTATGRISMLAYMAFLDFGTRRIRSRPWYHVTIRRLRKQLTRLALGK